MEEKEEKKSETKKTGFSFKKTLKKVAIVGGIAGGAILGYKYTTEDEFHNKVNGKAKGIATVVRGWFGKSEPAAEQPELVATTGDQAHYNGSFNNNGGNGKLGQRRFNGQYQNHYNSNN